MFYKVFCPLTQSFDLVYGDTIDVSNAVFDEVKRYTKNENGVELKRILLKNIGNVFENIKELTNAPTKIFVFPTTGKWSIIWSNSFLCNGFDTLSYNLTKKYEYKTFHFCSHDTITTMLSGTYFYYRFIENGNIKERYVWACKNDNNKWEFLEKGEHCDFEDINNYKHKIIKNRLNEKEIQNIFNKIGINPWNESAYKINDYYYEISRTNYPNTITKKEINEILTNGI